MKIVACIFFCLIIFFLDVCQEKNSIEDNLRAKFEHEVKLKLDELHRTLEKDYNEQILHYKNNSQQDNQVLQIKYNQDLERQSKEIEKIKINHEKMINELNIELDRLRANGMFTLKDLFVHLKTTMIYFFFQTLP
jgi:hypothetical protein